MSGNSKYPESQLYLVHGNNEADVNNARYELVCQILTPEERDSGLTEITGPGNQPLTLARALSEIIGELGTSSFIAGSRRVVVVYDLKEFYGASASKKAKAPAKTPKKAAAEPARSPETSLVDWLRDILPTTENVVVFVCQENDEKQRVVSPHGELYRFVKSTGVVVERREKPLQFEFDNHLLSGNTAGAISLYRDWLKRSGGDSTARTRMYSTLANFIELLLQARCLQDARGQRVPEAQVRVEDGFPTMSKVPEWKSKKIHDIASRMNPQTLRDLIAQANRLQRIMYPTGDEEYVPSWEDYFETLVVQVTARR